jgi:hypothetical protein
MGTLIDSGGTVVDELEDLELLQAPATSANAIAKTATNHHAPLRRRRIGDEDAMAGA